MRPLVCGMTSELGEQAMSALWMRRAAATLAITAMLGAASSAVHAEIRDYEFRLVKSEMKKGDAEVAVRLVNRKTGKLVPNAVIFAKRIDMAPDGMEMMASSIEQLPSNEPGVYRFKTELSMQGRWQLSLGAKVQGEEGSVESKLVVKALP
jgi:YtkA-like